MRLRPLAALAAAGLFISPALADRKKTANTPETTPAPAAVAQAQRPCDAHCPASMTLPSPRYLQQPPQSCAEDPNIRMERLLKESEDLRRTREELHRFWMNNQPALLTYERLHKVPGPGESEQLTVKTYAVADLVVPVPPMGTAPPAAKPKTLEGELIRKITANVEPKTWSAAGGTGTIEYYPLGMALVINQTPVIQEAVEKYLDTLRKMSDRQVVTQVHLVTVTDAWFTKSGLAKAFAPCEPGCEERQARARCLTPEAATKLLRAAKEAGGITCLAAPRLTTLARQPGRLRIGETEHYLTSLTVNSMNGQVVYTPKNEAHDLGIDVTLEPEVSADGRFVKVAVTGSVKELAVRPVPMTPITTLVRGVTADGQSAEPVPFTQYIQEPKVLSRGVTGTVSVPDGGTGMLYCGKATLQETVKEPLPFAADVPILAALFARDRTETSTNHLLVLVTATAVKPDAECEQCSACQPCDGRLAKLLAEYGRACKEGKVEDARRLAIECLVIDPTCFGKK